MRISFRNGFYLGLLVAVVLGLWLWQLWQPARQVQLHSEHLLAALEEKDWEAVSAFVADDYHDQWGQDRTLVLARLREVLRYARNLRFVAEEALVSAASDAGSWKARIMIEAEANEVSEMIKARVNALEAPFVLHWQRQSGKPWDWQLVRVSNEAFELPEAAY